MRDEIDTADGDEGALLRFPRRRKKRATFGGTLVRLGSLELRLAETKKEIRRAQRLRYKVFYEDGCATPDMTAALIRRDVYRFDKVCDHLLVVDHLTHAVLDRADDLLGLALRPALGLGLLLTGLTRELLGATLGLHLLVADQAPHGALHLPADLLRDALATLALGAHFVLSLCRDRRHLRRLPGRASINPHAEP